MIVRTLPIASLIIAPCYKKAALLLLTQQGSGCGFMDDALRAPASLPWTTRCVAHRAGLRPQAPQPPTTMFELRTQIQGVYRDDNHSDAGGYSAGTRSANQRTDRNLLAIVAR